MTPATHRGRQGRGASSGAMDDGERVSVERRPPDETFALLANETRMAILQALG